MPKLTAGAVLARVLFDASQVVWVRDGWRLRLVPGTGYRDALQGQVREHDRTVLLYPDEAEMPLPELLFHEQAHILFNLNNFPPVEHLLVERACRYAYPLLGAPRTAKLQRLLGRADRNGAAPAGISGGMKKLRR